MTCQNHCARTKSILETVHGTTFAKRPFDHWLLNPAQKREGGSWVIEFVLAPPFSRVEDAHPLPAAKFGHEKPVFYDFLAAVSFRPNPP